MHDKAIEYFEASSKILSVLDNPDRLINKSKLEKLQNFIDEFDFDFIQVNLKILIYSGFHRIKHLNIDQTTTHETRQTYNL